MKFTVEIDDFWIEEEHLSEHLQRTVTNDVVNQIKKSIEDKVQTELTKAITEAINNKINPVIHKKITKLMAEGVVTQNGVATPLDQYIQKLFTSNTVWSNPSEQIRVIANKFGAELKTRYDANFATSIVMKLNEQGMLKDDVVKFLINRP